MLREVFSADRHDSHVITGGERPLIEEPIPTFLSRVAARFPGEEAVVSVHQGQRLTYRDFFQQVDRLARGLLALGVGKGDRVGIWSVNNVEWLLVQIATARVGAVLVNINPAYRTGELQHALSAVRVGTLFLMPSFKKSNYVDMIRRLCPEVEQGTPEAFRSARFPDLRRLVVFDPEDADRTERPAPAFLLWQEVVKRSAEVSEETLREHSATLEANEAVNIQFTSGTTGFAKPVVLSHRNILNNAWSVGAVLQLTPEDRVCVPVPFYHCFGMVVSNLACLAHGATIVLPATHFAAGAVLDAVEKERCTALHGVPTMFVAALELQEHEPRRLDSLRTGIMAGAPCPPELMRKVIDIGCREILIAYGQTEASPVTHITRPTDSFERRVETVGTNLPHQEVKIVAPDTGETLPVGEQGELCFRGYHVMRGYFEQEEATQQTIDEDGWLHSGDLGVMDDDGYVRITGRLKDMIIRGGENVYPAEIEAWYATHPKVAQAAVFGIPDERWGEEIGAWIELHEGETATIEDMRAWAAEGLAHFKVPRYLRLVENFPMTVTGKIQKFRIREIVEEECSRGGALPADPGLC